MLKSHAKIERAPILMAVLIVIVVSIGGIWEIAPLFKLETVIEPVQGMRPYTPLELAGQNIYKREGCYNCHSQQVRPLRDEVERYGHFSLAAESMYDHPFQWGSKRTGPDLARVGEKYSDEWHVAHMINPRDVVPESIMPAYPHLAQRPAYLDDISAHLSALRATGVPYTPAMIKHAYRDAIAQARADNDAPDLIERYGAKVTVRDFDGDSNSVSELDALIAYLQRLGNLVDTQRYDMMGQRSTAKASGPSKS
jgi:cytochrome c oxidase cbb3-type subunit II